jgi:hypothetical protein
MEVGFVSEGDAPEIVEEVVKLSRISIEPFVDDHPYDFAASDLPTRAIEQGRKLAFRNRLRPPPREVVFLDRKTAGVFVFLAVLRAKVSGRELLGRYVLTPSDEATDR